MIGGGGEFIYVFAGCALGKTTLGKSTQERERERDPILEDDDAYLFHKK